jgi:hypothetical protein
LHFKEIGRAGRDGNSSYCHLLLSPEDYVNLKSLCYADTIDQNTILKFLKLLFQGKQRNELIAIPEEKIQYEFDTKLEVLHTLLSYLQISGNIELLPGNTTTVKSILTKYYQRFEYVGRNWIFAKSTTRISISK